MIFAEFTNFAFVGCRPEFPSSRVVSFPSLNCISCCLRGGCSPGFVYGTWSLPALDSVVTSSFDGKFCQIFLHLIMSIFGGKFVH